ncbi:MAG: RNase adapter RapZ [Candidatus Limnocylindrales bacterium]
MSGNSDGFDAAGGASLGEAGVRSRKERRGRPVPGESAAPGKPAGSAPVADVTKTPAEAGPENAQRVVILSGLSGAGKTAATKLFEDLGYTCMDNVPGELLPDLAELVSTDRHRFEKVAIVLDVRAGNAPLALSAMRGALEGRGIEPRVIFLEARDDVLIRRFSETRHRHPLAGRRGIAGSIAEERRRLDPIRADSDIVVDTSDLSLRQLKERIFSQLADAPSDQGLVFQLISFGFKYGVPLEADLVFDVRFMENPYYVDELRHLSGLTPAVRDYVMGQPIARQFFDLLSSFLDLTVPGFKSEGKTRLTIAIGCTGGYHRSIAITEELRSWLEKRGYGSVAVFHRELERE